ncbi:MAG: AAA-like domain-containing protein [Candidatus Aminicenantes bacterium]|nr:AAA-like domain-containing protein [Candidatus Aminicenantes bacterium]
MERFFNTAGPVKKDMHYCIEPLTRFDLDEILALIKQEKYFVLHAPRQTGKTSYMLALMDYINEQGTYKALYVNVESAQAARGNVEKGIRTILDALASFAFYQLKDTFLQDNRRQILGNTTEFFALQDALTKWSAQSEKPLVLFIDEIDALVGDTLISVLRQLRSGYTMRPKLFPQSVVLCGVRDVRDYRIYSKKEKDIVTGGSAFNVKAKSLRMGIFTAAEINTLYKQHTKETGQEFSDDVFPLVWELTGGQPWLVNALAYEVCFEMKECRDRTKTISADKIEQAKENLILRRETHLDQLADKLKEDRVARVLEPILSGFGDMERVPDDDVDYVIDLGLVKRERQLKIANGIYREVIPRQLTYTSQLFIHQEAPWYMNEDGSLDMDKLLTAFQDFFRKQFESWVDGFKYAEAGPQLLLQAFLQRIVNGGGRVEREYGLGRQRTDLLLIWPIKKGVQQVVLELKIRHLHSSMETVIEEGLKQTRSYMDKCGTTEGYLLVFDRSDTLSWDEKISQKEKRYNKVKIGVYCM